MDKKILGNKRKEYLDWDEFFIGVAKLSAGRSKDPSTQVGACIVGEDNRILSIGYNGAPNNFSDEDFPWERDGEKEMYTKYPYVCHAELNAILNFPGSRKDLKGSRIYVDLFPCNECAKAIIQAGISEVVYLSDKYKDTDMNKVSKHLFDMCGVTYREIKKENQKVLRLSLKPDEEIEKSIIKTFRKEIWSRFIKGVKDYELINENDSIMVCISGGKDSFLLAKLLQELNRHSKYKFNLKYVVMNPGYKKNVLNQIKSNAKLLNIDIEIFDTDIFDVSNKLNNLKPCYLCARMRRGALYNKAKELGCNKIALGHHFNDVIETTLLSMFYASEVKTMMPKLHSTNFKGLELIRPMYLVKEESILRWVEFNNLEFINCACSFTEKSSTDEELSKRKEIKELVTELKKKNKRIDDNIFNALSNVDLNCILGTRVLG